MDSVTKIDEKNAYNLAFYSSTKNYYFWSSITLILSTIIVIAILNEIKTINVWVVLGGGAIGATAGGLLLWRWNENRLELNEYRNKFFNKFSEAEVPEKLMIAMNFYYHNANIFLLRARIYFLLFGAFNLILFVLSISPTQLPQNNGWWTDVLVFGIPLILTIVITPISYQLRKRELRKLGTDETSPTIQKTLSELLEESSAESKATLDTVKEVLDKRKETNNEKNPQTQNPYNDKSNTDNIIDTTEQKDN